MTQPNPPIGLEGGGSLELESGTGYLALEGGGQIVLAQATQPGQLQGVFYDIGDIFVCPLALYSDSTVSLVPVGNPDYPLYGWMKLAPAGAAPSRWQQSSNGSPRNAFQRYVI